MIDFLRLYIFFKTTKSLFDKRTLQQLLHHIIPPFTRWSTRGCERINKKEMKDNKNSIEISSSSSIFFYFLEILQSCERWKIVILRKGGNNLSMMVNARYSFNKCQHCDAKSCQFITLNSFLWFYFRIIITRWLNHLNFFIIVNI